MVVDDEPGEIGPMENATEDSTPAQDVPILLGRDAIRAAWEAAKRAE